MCTELHILKYFKDIVLHMENLISLQVLNILY